MTCATIIVTYNSAATIRRCLDSLYTEVNSDIVRVIVVDNASIDDTTDIVSSEYPWVKLICSPVNGGFGAGNNLGLNEVVEDYVFLLNPDCEMVKGTIEQLMKFLSVNPSVGCVGPTVVDADGDLTMSYEIFLGLAMSIWISTGFQRIFPINRTDGKVEIRKKPPGISVQVDRIIGAAMMFRHSALQEVKGFDERFFLYSEEEDLCYRLRQHNWYTWYLPDVRITHIGAGSTSDDNSLVIAATVWSRQLYMTKHFSSLVAAISRISWLVMLVVRWIIVTMFRPDKGGSKARGYLLAMRSLVDLKYFDNELRPPH